MAYIKNSMDILEACAKFDLPDSRRALNESAVKSDYFRGLEEVSGEYCVGAYMVPVVEMSGEYYTEANFLYPFMRDNNISSIMEALDLVAEANKMPEKSVGLLIESDNYVTGMIEKACGASKKESCAKTTEACNKQRESVIAKIGKVTDLACALKDKGYKCKKKPSKRSIEKGL